jgi:hypothetical protein
MENAPLKQEFQKPLFLLLWMLPRTCAEAQAKCPLGNRWVAAQKQLAASVHDSSRTCGRRGQIRGRAEGFVARERQKKRNEREGKNRKRKVLRGGGGGGRRRAGRRGGRTRGGKKLREARRLTPSGTGGNVSRRK